MMAEDAEVNLEISAEGHVQQEEGAAKRLCSWVGVTVTTIAVATTLFHLHAAYDIVPTIPLRYTHVAFALLLSFCCYRSRIASATASNGST
jgi:TRAP-type uncharacterized transport system fused permease subunit